MTASAALRSGKGHRDENFPVASLLIERRHRPIILAFYNFVRVADDIADHSSLGPDDKLARLDRLEASLLGKQRDEPEGTALCEALRERGLSPQHAQDLLRAFRQDVVKLRYDDWSDLIGYCTYSAMPVGRFVLDVHGEAKSTWPASDALCAALQIINHLQDCAADYRNLNRVYLPLDALADHGVGVEALGEARASPALLACLHDLAGRTAVLLDQSRTLPEIVADTRLAMEISAIETLAGRLVALLRIRDPLAERVHLTKPAALVTGAAGAAARLLRVLFRRASHFYRSLAQEY
ncbi:MAG TPA: squalene synthase HpnC [Xanthobacteraceae bacterium]|nr:squalene synthase HpnC [Xanthobacteraceae bacterium]